DLLGSLPYFAEALHVDKGDPDRELQHRVRFASARAQCPKLVQMWFMPGELYTTGFSPDGQHVLAFEWAGKGQVFDVQTGNPVSPRFGPGSHVWRGRYDPDGKLVVAPSVDGTATVWRVSDGAKVVTVQHPDRGLC